MQIQDSWSLKCYYHKDRELINFYNDKGYPVRWEKKLLAVIKRFHEVQLWHAHQFKSYTLTISSMFFSEKYRWVSLRTYCWTVSSLLFFVWLGDLAIISKDIFPMLKSNGLVKKCFLKNALVFVMWPANSYSFPWEQAIVPRLPL